MLRLTNIGNGPAVDVDVKVVFEGYDSDASQTRQVKTGLFLPGESYRFYLRQPGGHIMLMDTAASTFRRIVVTGKLSDSLGKKHEVNEESETLKDYWDALQASGQALEQDPLERIADAVTEMNSRQGSDRLSRYMDSVFRGPPATQDGQESSSE